MHMDPGCFQSLIGVYKPLKATGVKVIVRSCVRVEVDVLGCPS